MVTKEQFFNGVVKYIDKEVIPHLPTTGKWGVGAFTVLLGKKYDSMVSELVTNPAIKALGVVDEKGLIDVESLYEALKTSANKYGNIQLTFPIIGTLTFTEKDIDSLKTYIVGECEDDP